jgi:hypothetical protein
LKPIAGADEEYSLEPIFSDREMHIAYLTKDVPTYAYAAKENVWGNVPVWLVAVLAIGYPILVYLWSAVYVRSFWDVNNAVCSSSSFPLLLSSLLPTAVMLCPSSLIDDGEANGRDR